ncbi:MAG: T9SS type A sorting domain-containing protein, partial [Saprospiraceae bacterium]|nr:T9SS type A sorting domain-containing protein [Saprospiraceae bacterium]
YIEGDGIETIEIINVIGQTIKEFTLRNKTILIDLSSQTKGTYFVRITTNNGVVVEKVVLE